MDELEAFLASDPKDPDDDLPTFDNPRPLRWAIPALGLMLTLALVWQERADFEYLAAPPTPIELGGPGAYHFERAHAEAFVRIEGRSGPEASVYRSGLFEKELLPFVDVPVIIDRPRQKGAALPQQLAVEGRLEPDDRQLKLRGIIRYFLEQDELAPPGPRAGTGHVWIVAAGQRPRSLDWNAAWCALLVGLLAFNVAWLWRRLAR